MLKVYVLKLSAIMITSEYLCRYIKIQKNYRPVSIINLN